MRLYYLGVELQGINPTNPRVATSGPFEVPGQPHAVGHWSCPTTATQLSCRKTKAFIFNIFSRLDLQSSLRLSYVEAPDCNLIKVYGLT